MRRGAVTIKDVAEAAGVHISTVSRALAPATRHLISAEIAQRIDAVAKELGYARNAIASSLRTRRSMTVGVLIPDITNPLFPPMLRGIEDALGAEFTAIIANTDNDPEREATGARRLLARSVDGLILATVRRRDGADRGARGRRACRWSWSTAPPTRRVSRRWWPTTPRASG